MNRSYLISVCRGSIIWLGKPEFGTEDCGDVK